MTNGLKHTEEEITTASPHVSREEAMQRLAQMKQESASQQSSGSGSSPLSAIQDILKNAKEAIGGGGSKSESPTPSRKAIKANGHGLSLTTGNEILDDGLHLALTVILFTGLEIYFLRIGKSCTDWINLCLLCGTVFSQNKYVPMRLMAFLWAGYTFSTYLIKFIYN